MSFRNPMPSLHCLNKKWICFEFSAKSNFNYVGMYQEYIKVPEKVFIVRTWKKLCLLILSGAAGGTWILISHSLRTNRLNKLKRNLQFTLFLGFIYIICLRMGDRESRDREPGIIWIWGLWMRELRWDSWSFVEPCGASPVNQNCRGVRGEMWEMEAWC